MPEAQGAPGRFVGEHGVNDGENGGVKDEETHESRAGAGQSPAGKGGDARPHGQEQNERLTPDRPARTVKEEEALPIEAPSVNMRRSALGALEPNQIGPRGVEQTGWVGEEGGEQEHHDGQPDQARGDEVRGAKKILLQSGCRRGARERIR